MADYKSDIQIAQETPMLPILQIANKLGLSEDQIEYYGKYKAKVDPKLLNQTDATPGKLILVTAINPTAAGEGKTTVTGIFKLSRSRLIKALLLFNRMQIMKIISNIFNF